jgi:hypothetical protein
VQVHTEDESKSQNGNSGWEVNGWHIKVYGIAYNRPLPRADLITVAKRAAASVLPQPRSGRAATALAFSASTTPGRLRCLCRLVG